MSVILTERSAVNRNLSHILTERSAVSRNQPHNETVKHEILEVKEINHLPPSILGHPLNLGPPFNLIFYQSVTFQKDAKISTRFPLIKEKEKYADDNM